MVLGVFIISIGIALFKESHLGNDPISALNMRIAEIFGIPYGFQNLLCNILFFLIQFIFGRKYIGAGTFVNGILLGYIVSFFYAILLRNFGPAEEHGLIVQIVWAAVAVVVTSLGVSLYQTASGLHRMTIFPWGFEIRRRNIILPVECLRMESVLWERSLQEGWSA